MSIFPSFHSKSFPESMRPFCAELYYTAFLLVPWLFACLALANHKELGLQLLQDLDDLPSHVVHQHAVANLFARAFPKCLQPLRRFRVAWRSLLSRQLLMQAHL